MVMQFGQRITATRLKGYACGYDIGDDREESSCPYRPNSLDVEAFGLSLYNAALYGYATR
jgi:hypothetical protein